MGSRTGSAGSGLGKSNSNSFIKGVKASDAIARVKSKCVEQLLLINIVDGILL